MCCVKRKAVQDLEYGAAFFDEPTFPMGTESSWVTAFCAGMKQLGMLWGCATRLDEIEESMIPQLAASGLRYLYFGLEILMRICFGGSINPLRLVK